MSIRRIATSPAFLVSLAFLIGFGSFGVRYGFAYHYEQRALKEIANPSQPVYRDVNKDGVNDEIRKVPVRTINGFTDYLDLREEVLYGVKLDGQMQYLPKKEFEELKGTQ